MKNLDKFYINGTWVEPISSDKFPVINPANEETIAYISLGDERDVDNAVVAANNAFLSFSETSKSERINLLKSLRIITEKRLDELAEAITIEDGSAKYNGEDAQADAALGHLDGFIEALSGINFREELYNGDILLREPIGVCGLITPGIGL